MLWKSRAVIRHALSLLVLTALVAFPPASPVASACPFCSSVSQTFSEEMDSMQAVVMAQLERAPAVPEAVSTDPDAPLPRAEFKVTQVLKGEEFVKTGELIEVLFFGEANKQRSYLIMGTQDASNVMWSTPLGLSDRARDYVLALPALPKEASRLEFFQEYLEDEDEMLARDAYDEFAKTPYDGVIALKEKMHHDRLISWIKDKDVPASRRRLYFTMLGVCGVPETDAPLLRSMMNSDDRRTKAGLDAMIACYLILTGADGLDEVEAKFLENKEAEYADTYAAIMAIRFHGNDTDVIPKTRLVKALRKLLERPELADLVIPDLARWEDWEVLPRMVQLFREADEKSSWVRVPVINYLRSCPLPEAKQQIDELAKIDPEAVKRAQTFFPFDAEGDGGKASETANQDAANQDAANQDAAAPSPVKPDGAKLDGAKLDGAHFDGGQLNGVHPAGASGLNALALGDGDSERSFATALLAPGTITVRGLRGLAEETQTLPVTQASRAVDTTPVESPEPVPNRGVLWGVPIVLGIALLYTYRLILGVPFRLER